MSVLDVVRSIPDPELPMLTIEDLGILRSVDIDGRAVRVQITPTYSGCPALDAIAADITAALPDHDVTVETVLSPPWTSDWLTERGRAALEENGVAAPVFVGLPARRPACPLCGSADTEELSRFGATACKALWRCRACREPFEQFKQH